MTILAASTGCTCTDPIAPETTIRTKIEAINAMLRIPVRRGNRRRWLFFAGAVLLGVRNETAV